MRIGAIFPQIELGHDAGAAKAYAQGAEALGFDHIGIFDHVVGGNPKTHKLKGPYSCHDSFLEPFALYSYMAALTSKIELATAIIIVPQRQTVLVAKQAATLDVLSGGRFRFGIGIGWNDVEYQALGEDFATRGARCEEQVGLLRALWTKPLVTFKGRFDEIVDAGLNPLPVQRPIPIWFGGHSDAVMRRAARLGDGWLPLYAPNEQGAKAVETFKGYVREAGRDPAKIGLESWINVGAYDDGFGARYETEQSWHDWAVGWKRLGATHLSINTMKAGLKTVDEHLGVLARVRTVIAKA
ncbi:MAG: LLM class F420-dependent oxidoreductase [Alphaproteobacteria bacterium]|nr:LLM class F420-dependent oxidoreductase [Alphaproteobacteria bacterium]